MLFNSYEFLLCFFPVCVVAYGIVRRHSHRLQMLFLLAASLAFYGWWDIRFLPLLLVSIGANYGIGLLIRRALDGEREASARRLLAAGVLANLLVLAGFKYVGFAAVNLNSVLGTGFNIYAVILPLGISFFTFEQIGFLVDVRHGRFRPGDLLRYALFVSFFPRLVAGPILRYDEIAPQLGSPNPIKRAGAGLPEGFAQDLAVGLTIFVIGLVKKSLLADGIAPYAAAGFLLVERGETPDLLQAWGAALAYTFQLYFDFSGYSDMAIGAARCFGIRFPVNFASPYRATSIIEFWRRWHMTLSRFLRDYLYFGLGGSRRGTSRRYANLLLTMLLGGLWHGANWTFIAWGGLHGLYLVINHGWLAVAQRSQWLMQVRASFPGRAAGWTLTFLAVVIGWVFFRATDAGAAWRMLGGMAGLHGATVPSALADGVPALQGVLAWLGIGLSEVSGRQFVLTWAWIAGLLALALLAPNTQTIVARGEPVLKVPAKVERSGAGLGWAPSVGWAVVIGTAAFLGLISITRVSEFLYWQF